MAHHLNLSKTELLFIPGKDFPHKDLSVTVEDITVSPSSTRNLDVILNNRLSWTPSITAVAWSCRFALYNIHRIQSFLTKDAMQLLVKALGISHLDYCNSLLAGLPPSVTKPLTRIQKSASCLHFNLPIFSHVTPLRDLHWLPVAAHIQFKTIAGLQRNCTHLPPNAGQTTLPSAKFKHLALLHKLAGLYRHRWEQTKVYSAIHLQPLAFRTLSHTPPCNPGTRHLCVSS